MGLEDELFDELFAHREELRKKNRYSNGREPVICGDPSLRTIAQRIPTKLEDFTAIEGIGNRFVEQYGESFLAITKKYAVTAAKGSAIDDRLAQTLRELQKKLVNISRANRLLFQPRMGLKSAFDPSVAGKADVLGLVFGKEETITVCDSKRSKEEEKLFRRVNEILREVNRDQREKGAFDLYVAYPFVEGKLTGLEDFPVRAPLALFPVTMEKENGAIKVRKDDSRDAVYNNTLLLAAMKVEGKNRPLPDNVIENYDEGTFIDDLVLFYKEQGLVLDLPADVAVRRFTEYRSTRFPEYAPGELHLAPNVVIGKYPPYSSFIQRDFDTLLSGREINGTLSDLIKDLDEGDMYSDYPLPLTQDEIEARGYIPSERDLFYINSLNSAQETILTAVDRTDEIVVQGPPGTGKSQVITGLISSAIATGKTVLMVSEKKTALDVVYSRLGGLSKYCLQIDDTADKESFYRQLGTILNIRPTGNYARPEEVSDRIDADIDRLTHVATEIYGEGAFGLSACSLYSRGRWIDPEDGARMETYNRFRNCIPPTLLETSYPTILQMHGKFKNSVLIRNIQEYTSTLERSPWLSLLRPDLGEYEINEMMAELDRLDREVRDLGSKGFLTRLFSKGKIGRDATDIVNRYFTNYNDRIIDTVMSDPADLLETMGDYDVFSVRAASYHALSPLEKDYGKSLMRLSHELAHPPGSVNDDMVEFILDDHLQRFDSTHGDLLKELEEFDATLECIDEGMEQKRDLTKRLVEGILGDNLRYITESKRRGDIARIVENKRKWSLNKFINRYGYELFKGVRIWLLTPEAVSDIIPMEMGLFDLLIFDEASQMYVEKGIPSIYRAKKVVVAGDHKQLRPSSLGTGRVSYEEDSEEDAPSNGALDEESLLDLARARYDNILLNFHYRSKYEELIAFSNHAFYGGKLYVAPNISQPEKPPIEVFRVDGRWEDRQNHVEADKIVKLLKEFFRTRQNNETIGIITFNISQRDLINDKIEECAANDPEFAAEVSKESGRHDNGEDVGLFVKNIESVQGDERDVIMFSIGYARNSEGKFLQRFGWLNLRGGENRLNVAISRARKKICIVSSFDPEELRTEDTQSEGPKILRKYLQYAQAVNDRDAVLTRGILEELAPAADTAVNTQSPESPVLSQVFEALTDRGYEVEKNVGIGGYTIDLAVKMNGRYVLGLELDERVYRLARNTRERDYHRKKYLESRGWTIRRIWTPGLYRDPEKEISGIVAAIENISGTQ